MGIAQGQRVVVGVSGGADSLALLHLFVQSRESLGIVPMAVHVHHGMRGEAADADAAFVAEIAQTWGIVYRVERMDVPALARDRRFTLEEAARKARYTALSKVAREVGAACLAVAHQADDQAETVLMHLLRGSGLAGLRGMLPVTVLSGSHVLNDPAVDLIIVRPLLDVPRSEILAYCESQGLTPREDETNENVGFLRNRVRHTILPLLYEVNPRFSEQLVQTAHLLQADFDALDGQVEAAWKETAVKETEGSIHLDRDRWKALPLAVQRGILRRAIWRLVGGIENLGFEHVESAVQVGLNGDPGAQAIFPGGVSLTVAYDSLRIAWSDYRLPAPDWPLLAPESVSPLQGLGPRQSLLVTSEWTFTVEGYDGPREGASWEAILNDPWKAVIDADRFSGKEIDSLALRTRRPGDRFQPQGVPGTQKLSDFMINEKIPAAWRDRLPLLVTGAAWETIIWVCGFRVDARYVVQPSTCQVVLLRFERLSDEGEAPF